MKVLLLGGTVFLGRHTVEAALARGDEVTVFTRGVHNGDLHAGAVEHLRGDRTRALRGRRWDVAIDTCGFEPEHVEASSALLAHAIEHLVYVSSISAYREWPEQVVDEDSPVHESDVREYGELNAACERAAEVAMPGRVAIVRAGGLAGPHDNVFRHAWWLERVAAGGEVVAPQGPDAPLQLIDARDLGAWMLELGAGRIAGRCNGTGPRRTRPWASSSAQPSPQPAAARSSAGSATTRLRRPAWSHGPRSRCGRRGPARGGVGTERARAALGG